MVKSRRFHKRVQKRHTRKHKPTRKKNKMNKIYSIKQRGGIPVGIGAASVALVALAAGGAYLLSNRAASTLTNSIKDHVISTRGAKTNVQETPEL